MVANHPGMSDQTSTNIARDGAAKRPQKSFATTHGHKNTNAFAGAGPANPGMGPDGAPANVMSPEPKSKKSGTVATSWGMKGKHDPVLGSKVLAEAANLGR